VGIMGRDEYLAIILFLIFRWHCESIIHVTGLNKTKQSFLQQHTLTVCVSALLYILFFMLAPPSKPKTDVST
jgi:hypothetical protein